MPYVIQGKSKLHYRVIGQGSRVLLAFHGYGQSSAYYQPMEQALGKDYTIYAFDLFFHGRSHLHKQHMPLQKELLKTFTEHFLEKKGINRFSLMGFSMGGKFALTLVECMPQRVEELFLIAPDGIKTSFWYNIATYPGWLQQLFKRTVLKPELFFKLLRLLDRYNMVHRSLLRFAHNQMDSTPKRLRVYRSWVGFRQLNFDIRHIVRLLNKQKVPVTMFLGQYDQVISPKRVGVFVDALDKGELVILKAGHSHLLQEVATLLHKKRLKG
ncbi:pimeloyl-ACP methyl ester carboxylesterase [Pontibacter ummariensis]|uniref:Pimeloyl-ACP methyl ester carboxylesterase n=1 Tax=Pontibacter ummariensis TaxID=1610492 RepID=A0A239DYH9_9BACT|nr:alpha/beta hydrolase [Pontibacter ummariensis]PRY13691.1 pimeloyl-ACP methyl ester carboxylesterase [Pontibacter ummariensis]SNS37407.1 Pimeloyl-ACP methyl ester carboxylesterase [Pontibacter ummariensis]